MIEKRQIFLLMLRQRLKIDTKKSCLLIVQEESFYVSLTFWFHNVYYETKSVNSQDILFLNIPSVLIARSSLSGISELDQHLALHHTLRCIFSSMLMKILRWIARKMLLSVVPISWNGRNRWEVSLKNFY